MRQASAVLDRWGYRASTRRQAPVAGRVQPGPAAQPQSPARRPGHRGVRPRCARIRPPTGTRDRCCMRCSGWSPRWAIAIRRCAPDTTTPPSIDGADPAWARLDRTLARHLDTDPAGPRAHPHHHGQDRPLAGRRAPRDHRARPVDQGDLRGLGRRGRPDDASATTSSAATALGAPRSANRSPPRTKAHIPHGHPRLLPRLPGMGMDRRAGSTRTARWPLPRSIAALIGTNPRVIADEVWAKLLWAGLNLDPADLPGNSADTYYPMELIRAVTLTWLFSGLRSDEISRLRVGCIRWQHDGLPIPGDSREILAEDAVCLLDVPVHKTGTAFTKPVDPIVGPGHRGMAGAAARPAERSGPQDRRARRHAVLGPRPARRQGLHQPHDHPGALRARPASPPPTSAATSPATAPAPPSPASSTTPRNR